jgi:hypothetical protein
MTQLVLAFWFTALMTLFNIIRIAALLDRESTLPFKRLFALKRGFIGIIVCILLVTE